MTCYIDGDIVAYRCAASCENEEEAIAYFRIDDMMNTMLLHLQCEHYVSYLTGPNNFRKVLFPDYKANRKGKPKPKWLDKCREYMQHKWNATVTNGIEADDALGISATHELGSVVCSIDKDLMQIPGDHYNFVKDEHILIGGRAADLSFWTQLLVGDTSDNIRGVDGIGPVKAQKRLQPLKNDLEWFESVRNAYDDDQRFLLNLNLFWIQRNEGKIWIHEHKDLAQMLPSELVEEVEQKFSTHMTRISSPSGTMELGGISPSTISTEPTV